MMSDNLIDRLQKTPLVENWGHVPVTCPLFFGIEL
jgi:hypothetical protein